MLNDFDQDCVRIRLFLVCLLQAHALKKINPELTKQVDHIYKDSVFHVHLIRLLQTLEQNALFS